MESEKVKEIKIVLKGLVDDASNWLQNAMIGGVNLADILTLINELESENERLSKELDSEWKDRRKAEEDLHKAQWNYKIGLGQSRKRNKELKDRIAELEKENGELKQHITEVEKGIINIAIERNKKDELASKFIDSYNDSLKQFAEKLKEKLKARHEVNRLLLMPVRDVVLSTIEGLLEDVDKTLKELINE